MTVRLSSSWVGITFSAFDLFHAGHVMMLQKARHSCDYIIAGLHVDPSIERPEKNKPVQSLFERYMQLDACQYIDKIIPYNTEQDIISTLNTEMPDVRILGSDYINMFYTGKSDNIRELFCNRSHGFSSSELKGRIINA